MQQLTVELDERSYPIQVGTGLLEANPALVALARGRSVAAVSDTTVDRLFGDRLARLRSSGRSLEVRGNPDPREMITAVEEQILDGTESGL